MEEELISILEDLTDKEFRNLKWHLKRLDWNSIKPIKSSQLEKAEREDTVDLMVQKYESGGAVEVMEMVLQKIQRNDLAKSLQRPTAEVRDREPLRRDDSAERGVPAEEKVGAAKRLMSARTEFIDRVSEPVLNKLLDKLLQNEVINDEEMESVRKTRADKAREVIDMVRRKGDEGSFVLIKALGDVDSCLYKELNL